MHIYPFQPLIPASNTVAATLTSPPYDSLSSCDAARLLSTNPNSVLSIIRPDAAFPSSKPSPSQLTKQAATSFSALLAERAFVPELSPTLYIYELSSPKILHRGVVATLNVLDYLRGQVKKHEHTRPDKEEYCANLSKALNANAAPVFLTYRAVPEIDQFISRIVLNTEPLFSVTDPDNDAHNPMEHPLTHNVYRVPPSAVDTLSAFFADSVPHAYIADGHHRAATAANLAIHTSTTASARFPAFLFPHTDVTIVPFNRLVQTPQSVPVHDLLHLVARAADVVPLPKPPLAGQHPKQGHVFMYVDRNWFDVTLPLRTTSEDRRVAHKLDAVLLQRAILLPALDIQDPRTDPRLAFIRGGGEMDVMHLARSVDRGDAAIAFQMRPVDIDDVMRVADAGEVMPPKSTCFEPKPRCGFFVHQM